MQTNQTFHGSAHGRLDFMGGVADYSGSLVLETPIAATTRVTVTSLPEKNFRVSSASSGDTSIPAQPFLDALRQNATDDQLRALLDAANAPRWSRYILGSLLVFCSAKKWQPASGLAFHIESHVPQSMGVSSSAALEIATLRALEQMTDAKFSGTEMARLGQRAENHLVGAPCGLMDQLTCAFGEPHHLLPILCRPDTLQPLVKLPDDVTVVGWPSGVKHDVGASPYATARAGAFMGKKIVEHHLQRKWNHAAEIAPELIGSIPRSVLPDEMRGDEFIAKYNTTDDPLSVIEPTRAYPVRAALRFPITENARCELVAAMLREIEPHLREQTLQSAGNYLLASHAGYSAMGLGSAGTDEMVSRLMEVGGGRGIYGARISGGGSGGTVVVLLKKSALPLLEELSRKLSFTSVGPLPLIF